MPQISYKTNADSIEESMSIANHKIGLEKIAALLMDRNTGVINSTQDIDVGDIVSFMVELVSLIQCMLMKW
jgi:hypothetical protein